jgi:hypothetical protein
LIEPEDTLFVTGTLTENPGIQVRPFEPRNVPMHDASTNDVHTTESRNYSSEQLPAPQIVRLQSGEAPSSTQEMSQQAKIAAALNRAGITKPEAWSVAGVPYQSVAVEEKAPPASDPRLYETRPDERHPGENQPKPSSFNLTPPAVLMRGENDATFVISFRSQKEFVRAFAWKSAAMIWGGAAITLLGLYTLLVQLKQL